MITTTARLLVQVITGGRPVLKDRPTAKFLVDLRDAGFPVEWVVREDHASEYERDDVPLNIYPLEWANQYAEAHWRHPTFLFKPGSFHGAFTGREWAMRTGERGGFDLVLQLDDNVTHVGVIEATSHRYRTPGRTFAEQVHIMAELAMSTNAATLGMQLNSVVPRKRARTLRPGYPYSIFLEKCGAGRLPYFGPFEDDVMHSLEYARRGTQTSAVMDTFVYHKKGGGKTGMRRYYDPTRGLELAKRYPENAKLIISRRTSSPKQRMKENLGVRHVLNVKGFNPVKINNQERFATAEGEVHRLVNEAMAQFVIESRKVVAGRASGELRGETPWRKS